MKSPLHSDSAKLEMVKALAAGTTKAKSGKTPTKTVKAQEQMTAKAATAEKKAGAANKKWERPNLLALCRKLAGGDAMAGIWLFHILYVWRNRKFKLKRLDKEWLAHSREAWAIAAGLSNAEFQKRAHPRVKANCSGFLEVRAMGRGADKKIWVHVDEISLKEAVYGMGAYPWDMFYAALNGIGPGNEKPPANAYAKDK